MVPLDSMFSMAPMVCRGSYSCVNRPGQCRSVCPGPKHVLPSCHTMPPECGLVSLRRGENEAIRGKTQNGRPAVCATLLTMTILTSWSTGNFDLSKAQFEFFRPISHTWASAFQNVGSLGRRGRNRLSLHHGCLCWRWRRGV